MGAGISRKDPYSLDVKSVKRFLPEVRGLGFSCILGGSPHPVRVTLRDSGDYARVLLYSFHTTTYQQFPWCANESAMILIRGAPRKETADSNLREAPHAGTFISPKP